jgi:hypothetical protein
VLVVVVVASLAVYVLAATVVEDAAVEVDDDLAVDTGFNTARLDAPDEDEIEPICMIFLRI